jgi:hypothetical protein
MERKVLSDGRITDIVTELQDWPYREIKTHKDYGHPLLLAVRE